MDAPAEAVIDLAAIRDNVTALRRHVSGASLMAVVKSDGYGHGLVPAAAAALAGGAGWLGVIRVSEALALRQAGLSAPLLCLMSVPGGDHEGAIRQGVDLTAATAGLVAEIARAAQAAGRPARVHLKVDTGMSRGGATMADWPGLVAAALRAAAAGHVRIAGLFSHLACADMPGHPSVDGQVAAFTAAIAQAEKAGARPEVRHLANTPATLALPHTWFDLVRTGGGIYGLSTLPGGPPGWLRPAMTVRSRLVQIKRVPAGTGVSYGHRYVTHAPSTLGVIPIGYADGVPRTASNAASVCVRGRRWPVAGTVCMNHIVADFGGGPVAENDEVVLFGPGDGGEPTPQDWADALGTISYDVVTSFGGQIPRSYSGAAHGQAATGAGAPAAGRGPAPPG